MKINKKLLKDFIVEVYSEEKNNIIREIKEILDKKELLSLLKKELYESKVRSIVRENINNILREFDGISKKYDDDDDDDDENDIFGQTIKSSVSGQNIKIMTAYGDASHPDHEKAKALVHKAVEKDPELKGNVPEPGSIGSGSSGEKAGSKEPDDDEETGTVFKDKEPTYKGDDGEEEEDPTDRPGYIYGDDEIQLPRRAIDLPLYWKRKAAAGEEEEVMSSSPVKSFVYKSKKKKKGQRIAPGGFR